MNFKEKSLEQRLGEMTDIRAIQELCRQYGIRLTRAAGQNFLVDSAIVGEMVRAGEVKKTDRVIEIGPGFGPLTVALAEAAGEVIAIEKDPRVCEVLRENIAVFPNVRVKCGDILEIRNQELASGRPYKIVANLPYGITSAALRKFTEIEPRPETITVMVQKEVAERVCAKAGDMSVLSVAVQFYGTAEIVRMVSRASFWPEPQVDSAILRIRMKRREENMDEKKFFQLVKIGFSSRRKQLQNNLAAGFHISNDEAKSRLQAAGFDSKIRAEDLSVEDWRRLCIHINA